MHSLKTSASLISLLLSTPIHAATTARIWTHFFPACPGDPYSDLSAYESYEESASPQDISVGQCAPVSVPSFDHNLVNHISIDAELLSHETEVPYASNPDRCNCNITIHEVPGCIDPALISTELHNGVAVSKCTMRQFAAYSEVWAKLTCEQQHHEEEYRIAKAASTAQSNDLQTPGSSSESWRIAQTAQTTQSDRVPEEEQRRVDGDGRAASEKVLLDLLEYLMKKQNSTKLSILGRHNATRHLNGTLPLNGTSTASNRTASRRQLSVLRNRVRLY